MKQNILLSAAVVAAAALLPEVASASFLLDTGTPAGTSTYVLSTSQFFAGEFSVSAGQSVSQVAAYLTQGVGQPNDTFTFDVYSNTGFTSRVSSRPAPVFTTTGTFTANGWNSANVNWTFSTGGSYWLALQVGSTTNTKGLDLPGEVSSGTGTVPALGFAYAPTGGQYTTTGAPPIGLEVSTVPLPGALWLFGSGIAGLSALGRRRRVAQAV